MTSRYADYYGVDSLYKLKQLPISYLKYVGLWRPDTSVSKATKCLFGFYNKISLGVMFLFTITLFADMVSSMDDLSIASDDGCVFAGMFVVLFKVMVFQIYQDEIERLVEEIFELTWQLCQSSIFPQRNKEVIDRYIFRCYLCTYGFSLLGFFLVIGLIFLVPVEDGALPIRARYPFDVSRSPYHEIGFTIEAIAVTIGTTAIVGMDSIFTILLNVALLQFEILAMNFECCGEKAARSDSVLAYRNVDNFTIEYKRCIRHQQRLIILIDRLNEFYASSMFVQVLSSTTIICLTSFQAVVVAAGHRTNLIKFMIYLGAAVSQLLYCCWIGNELIHQSSSLVTGQWLSNWHERSFSEVASLLKISMMFSKKSVHLKAGKFFVMSLPGFIAIMRGSYSFFALLNNVHDKNDQN